MRKKQQQQQQQMKRKNRVKCLKMERKSGNYSFFSHFFFFEISILTFSTCLKSQLSKFIMCFPPELWYKNRQINMHFSHAVFFILFSHKNYSSNDFNRKKKRNKKKRRKKSNLNSSPHPSITLAWNNDNWIREKGRVFQLNICIFS